MSAEKTKSKDITFKVGIHISGHQKAMRALEECKKDLAEIFELIRELKNVDSERVLRALANLGPRDKAILSNFIERGEIYMKLQEIQKKEPKYIQ